MARPKGTKNIMRTPEEKEKIVSEYLQSNVGYRAIARKYNIYEETFRKWINQYNQKGIEGFKRKPNPSKGKKRKINNRIEQLEQEILKLRIENERLKKGYLVKGDGARKEYVTSLEKNTK